MWWQLVGTAFAAILGAMTLGFHGAMSLALGGGVGVVAALAFDFAAARGQGVATDPGAAVYRALRAEAIKIGVMVALCWLVLAVYKDVAKVWFISAFMVSTLALSAAFLVREN